MFQMEENLQRKNLLLSEKYKLPDCDHDVSIPNGIRQTQFEMENQIAITSPTISSGLSPTISSGLSPTEII